ncbi:MAG: hypothetical protein ABUK01_05300 [Leptospirales bacterium]
MKLPLLVNSKRFALSNIVIVSQLKKLKTILTVLLILFTANCKNITIEEVRENLRENLQEGDHEEKVLQYMKDHRFVIYGPVDYEQYMFDNVRDSTNELFENIDNYDISYYYTGVIRDADIGIFVGCDIYMRFYFSEQKILQGYVSEKICTGP